MPPASGFGSRRAPATLDRRITTAKSIQLRLKEIRDIAAITGTALANFDHPTVAEVTLRLRQTLMCLRQGDGEKQATSEEA